MTNDKTLRKISCKEFLRNLHKNEYNFCEYCFCFLKKWKEKWKGFPGNGNRMNEISIKWKREKQKLAGSSKLKLERLQSS